jgi:hypothetical protein
MTHWQGKVGLVGYEVELYGRTRDQLSNAMMAHPKHADT